MQPQPTPGGQPLEAVQGLADKCGAAPKHGANAKYLIIQAARLLAKQEKGSSQAGESNSRQAHYKHPSGTAAAAHPPCSLQLCRALLMC